MVDTKKMNESAFAKIVKEFNAMGELIRARQDEKQAIIDEFNRESRRFSSGKISRKTLISSAAKTNKEIQKLDEKIRSAMSTAGELASQAKRFTAAQTPRGFKAALTGVVRSGRKSRRKKARKKPVSKKKVAKKKPVKRRKVVKTKPSVKKKTTQKKPVVKRKKVAKKKPVKRKAAKKKPAKKK